MSRPPPFQLYTVLSSRPFLTTPWPFKRYRSWITSHLHTVRSDAAGRLSTSASRVAIAISSCRSVGVTRCSRPDWLVCHQSVKSAARVRATATAVLCRQSPPLLVPTLPLLLCSAASSGDILHFMFLLLLCTSSSSYSSLVSFFLHTPRLR